MKKCLFILALTFTSNFIFAEEQKSVDISISPSAGTVAIEELSSSQPRSKNGRCDCIYTSSNFYVRSTALRYLSDDGTYEVLKEYRNMPDCEYAMGVVQKCNK